MNLPQEGADAQKKAGGEDSYRITAERTVVGIRAEGIGRSTIHHRGIVRWMMHDAAGNGRIADHDAAGIVGWMMHDAAGIGRSRSTTLRVGQGTTPEKPPHGSGNLWAFETLGVSIVVDRGRGGATPRSSPDDVTSVARRHKRSMPGKNRGGASAHPRDADRCAPDPRRVVIRDPRDPRRVVHHPPHDPRRVVDHRPPASRRVVIR